MRILLVDDDEDIRDIVGMILRVQGHEVIEAVDGVDALERLCEGERPAMILLDLMMPRLDGQGVVKRMRENPTLADIPVVLLSGHQSVREQARALGAVGYLVKPVELADLLDAVQRVGASHGAEAAAP